MGYPRATAPFGGIESILAHSAETWTEDCGQDLAGPIGAGFHTLGRETQNRAGFRLRAAFEGRQDQGSPKRRRQPGDSPIKVGKPFAVDYRLIDSDGGIHAGLRCADFNRLISEDQPTYGDTATPVPCLVDGYGS